MNFLKKLFWKKLNLEVISGNYSKDKKFIYWFENRLELIKGNKYKVIGDNYIISKNSLYVWDKKIEWVDLDTFELICGWYSKDKDNVFYKNKKIEWADVSSFEIDELSIMKDKNNIYSLGEKVKSLKDKYSEEESIWERMSDKTFNEVIDNNFTIALCNIGFERIKKNIWVQDLKNGIRKIVTIRHWKWSVSTPMWGYSLDYVPNFNSSYDNIYWHRTNKSAMIDIFPLYFDFFKYTIEQRTTIKDHIKKINNYIPLIIKDMNDFYDLGNNTEDLIKILEKCKTNKTKQFRFEMWVQLPLAYIFTLNKNGNTKKANELLNIYLNENSNITPEVKRKFLERFDNIKK